MLSNVIFHISYLGLSLFSVFGFAWTFQSRFFTGIPTHFLVPLPFLIWLGISLINICFFNIPGLILNYSFIATGSLLGIYFLRKNRNSIQKPNLIFLLLTTLLSLHFFYNYLNLSLFSIINCFDDELAYFSHIKMILDSGSLEDPFSLRRMASYGGQVIFQSLFAGSFSLNHVPFFEEGFINFFIAWIIFAEFKKRTNSFLSIFFVFMFLISLQPRINTASTSSGLLFTLIAFLCLFYDWVKKDSRYLSLAITSCLICASLRANYLPACSILILYAMYRLHSTSIPVLKANILICGIFAFLFGFSLWKSSGTIFFPFFQGNLNPAYGTFDNSYSQKYFFNYFSSAVLASDLPILWVFLVFHYFIFRQLGLFLGFVSLVSFIIALIGMKGNLDGPSVHRYSYAWTTSYIWFSLIVFFEYFWQRLQFLKFFYKLCFGVFLFILFAPDAIPSLYEKIQITKLWKKGSFQENFWANTDLLELQKKTLPQEKIASVVSTPYLFDYSRNTILNLDILGNVSPSHGFNPNGNDQEIENYFRSLGIHYLVFEYPGRCQYSQSEWLKYNRLNLLEFKNNRYRMNLENLSQSITSQVLWADRHLNFLNYLERKKDQAVYKLHNYYLVRF